MTSHKSAGTVAQLPPAPVSKKTGVASAVPASPHVIQKPAHFSEDNLPVSIHLLGSSGPGDCGHSAPKSVLQKHVRVRSPSPLASGDSDLDMDTTNGSARHSLQDNIRCPLPHVCQEKLHQHQQSIYQLMTA